MGDGLGGRIGHGNIPCLFNEVVLGFPANRTYNDRNAYIEGGNRSLRIAPSPLFLSLIADFMALWFLRMTRAISLDSVNIIDTADKFVAEMDRGSLKFKISWINWLILNGL